MAETIMKKLYKRNKELETMVGGIRTGAQTAQPTDRVDTEALQSVAVTDRDDAGEIRFAKTMGSGWDRGAGGEIECLTK